MASASRRVEYLPIRTRNLRAAPLGGVVTKEGYPLPASRVAIVSASRRSLTAATCTTNPLPAGSPATVADEGEAFATAVGATGLAASIFVAGFVATSGTLFARPGSRPSRASGRTDPVEGRLPDPGFNLSSTGSCPSRAPT